MFGQYSRTAVYELHSDVYKNRKQVGNVLKAKENFDKIIKYSPCAILKFIFKK